LKWCEAQEELLRNHVPRFQISQRIELHLLALRNCLVKASYDQFACNPRSLLRSKCTMNVGDFVGGSPSFTGVCCTNRREEHAHFGILDHR